MVLARIAGKKPLVRVSQDEYFPKALESLSSQRGPRLHAVSPLDCNKNHVRMSDRQICDGRKQRQNPLQQNLTSLLANKGTARFTKLKLSEGPR